MNPRIILLFLIGNLFLVTILEAKEPLPAPKVMPGMKLGGLQMEWLGPFVSSSYVRVGNRRTHEVRWYSPEGKVLRSVSGANVSVHRSFVCDYDDDSKTIYGVNSPWAMPIPKNLNSGSYHTSTWDSRTYVVEHHPQKSQVAVDVYRDGKQLSTIGPYFQYGGTSVHLNDSGSLVFLTWTDATKKKVQIITAGPDGKQILGVNCPNPVQLTYGTSVSTDGTGVLIQPNRGGEDRHKFLFYTKAGLKKTFQCRYNPYPVLWLAGTHKALFSTSIGHDYQFQLIDCETGKTVWKRDDVFRDRVGHGAPQVVEMKHLLIIFSREYDKDKRSFRCFTAVNSSTGKIWARWRSDALQSNREDEMLFKIDRRLFLVRANGFSEILLDNVIKKKNGWK